MAVISRHEHCGGVRFPVFQIGEDLERAGIRQRVGDEDHIEPMKSFAQLAKGRRRVASRHDLVTRPGDRFPDGPPQERIILDDEDALEDGVGMMRHITAESKIDAIEARCTAWLEYDARRVSRVG